MNISDEAVEAAVHARGRASNPKWDHPISGYQTFSNDQKECLREQARIELEAAAPHMLAGAWLEGMEAMYATTSSEWPPIPEQNPYRTTR